MELFVKTTTWCLLLAFVACSKTAPQPKDSPEEVGPEKFSATIQINDDEPFAYSPPLEDVEYHWPGWVEADDSDIDIDVDIRFVSFYDNTAPKIGKAIAVTETNDMEIRVGLPMEDNPNNQISYYLTGSITITDYKESVVIDGGTYNFVSGTFEGTMDNGHTAIKISGSFENVGDIGSF